MLRAQSVAGVLLVLASGAFSSAGDSTPQAAVAAVEFPQFAEVAGLPHLRLDDVPLANETVSLVLARVEVFSRDARIVVVTDAGETEAPLPPVALFAGKVAGDPQSTAFLGVSPFGTYGFVSAGGRTQIISSGPAESGLQARIADAATLPAAEQPYRCFVDDSYVISPPGESDGGQGRSTPPCRTAVVAIETDYEFTQNLFGGNATASAAYVATLLGSVSAVYTRDLNVRLQVGYLRLWQTSADPWTGADTGAQLGEFRDYWNANMGGVYRHDAHFLSGRALGGGIAWVGVVCNTGYGYAVSGVNGYFPSPIVMNHGANWDLMVVAHELGHNFGAPHTHDMTPQVDNCANGDCSVAPNGTIMSYCHFCPNGMADVRMEFHPRSINEAMLPHLAGVCSLTGAPLDGSALWFDGGGDVVSVPSLGNSLPRNEVTVECWIYADDAWQRSAFGLNPDGANNRFQAHVPWSDGHVYWDFGNIGAGGRLSYAPPVSIVGSWQHFAFVASQSGNFMRIYRNGVLEAEKVGMRTFLGGNFEFRMGSLGTGNFLRGKLDEFRIWNVARTSPQIADNYRQVLNPAQQTGLAYYWRFEEGAGTTATDLVAGQVATVSGPAWINTDDCLADTGRCLLLDGSCLEVTQAACGYFGGSFQGTDVHCDGGPYPHPGACCLPVASGLCAYLFENDCTATGGSFAGEGTSCDSVGPLAGHAVNFDGADDRVQLGNGTSINFAGAITMEAWIRPDSSQGTRNIVVHGGATIPPRETGLRINGGAYEVFSFDGSTHRASYPIPAADLGRWVHLAGTHDGSTWRLYRNGVLAAQTADAVGAYAAGVQWGLGSRPTTVERLFVGSIDEVRLWNRARSATEIATDYTRSLVGNEAGLRGYWRLDDGTGTTAVDSSPFGNTGTLVNGAAWRTTDACAVPCLGDLNGDDQVALDDLTQLLGNFGETAATPAQGDLDGDADVDITDLSLMLSRFGVVC